MSPNVRDFGKFIRSRRRGAVLILAAIAVVAAMIGLTAGRRDSQEKTLSTRVKRGDFQVIVTTTGELRASKFVEIQVPPNAQQVNQYQMKI